MAYKAGVVCTDEALLYPEPYPSREAWCGARLAYTRERLRGPGPAAGDPGQPLPAGARAHPVLRYPVFAQWCGTTRPRTGTPPTTPPPWSMATCTSPHHLAGRGRFEEVSYGYPREWSGAAGRRDRRGRSCQIGSHRPEEARYELCWPGGDDPLSPRTPAGKR